MRRRAFIAGVGAAATFLAAWPLAVRAQQRSQHIAMLLPWGPDDPQGRARIAAFLQGMQQRGWTQDKNLSIDMRWSGGDTERNRRYAAELVARSPSVILAAGSATAGPLLQATRQVPIVFAIVPDPVGAGLVESLAHPGGNATGFTSFEYTTTGKWLELLREIAPSATRVAIVRDPAISAGIGQFDAVRAMAPSLGLTVTPVDIRNAADIERALTEFAGTPNSGAIVTNSALAFVNRDLIVRLANQNKLPVVYFERFFVAGGGLVSYGPDFIDQFRRAADYVDRILKGEKPADLPIQAPTRYELAVNLKTAKALGLVVPPTLLARADEVIE